MEKKSGPVYDFRKRVGHFGKHWENLFQELIDLGCDLGGIKFTAKIINEEKESVEITLPRRFTFVFSQELKNPDIERILENIKKITQKKIGADIVKIVGNSVFTIGENGLSYVSHILPVVYDKVRQRLEIKRKKVEEDKKQAVFSKRKEFCLLAEDVLKKAEAGNLIKRCHSYYRSESKSYYVSITTKSIDFRYQRKSFQGAFKRYEAINSLVRRFGSQVRRVSCIADKDGICKVDIVVSPIKFVINIGDGTSVKKDVYCKIRKILFLLKSAK